VNIPGPPPLPVVGNVLEMMGDPLVAFAQYRKTYGPIFKYYYFTGTSPRFFVLMNFSFSMY
jgi:hypothetical protein